MNHVWSCILRAVPSLLAAEACGTTRSRRSAVSALLALGAVSVASRRAVQEACEALRWLELEDSRIAPHVRLSPRTIAAYSSALCLLCGRRVRAARACSFHMHPSCVHTHRLSFVPMSSVLKVSRTHAPFLVADAFAYRTFQCVLVDRTWRFKESATPTALARRGMLRAANGI